ncbi:hypothetical protein [Pedobacter sp. L105]|uniref:hypothetical protein n=1 Tax=Pedobacter sp. L105 TaxID=1641871 RepID=UPI00131D242B|nr:hypothetical protein [Pedobacter sp. L105]
MFKCFVLSPLLLLCVISLVSCSSANNKPLLIKFSPDSSAIVFSGIDPAGLLQVRNIPHIDTAYSALISIVQQPAENDSSAMELPFPGKLSLTDSTVVFKPSTPFVKGRSYEVVSYLNAKFNNAVMLFSGKLNHRVKPEQAILKR